MKKRLFSLLLALLLCALLTLSVSAEAHPPRVVDGAGLLSASELASLTQRLDEISLRLDFDVIVVTAASLGGKSSQAYADDYFDYNGYGMGDGGILLLCAPNDGENALRTYSTYDKGLDIFDSDAFDALDDALYDLLEAQRYAQAFEAFAAECDDLVSSYGKPGIGTALLALLAGVLLALFIPMNLYKGQLKSVRSQSAASEYMRPGSMQLTLQRDMFLYRNITRTPRPKGDSSGSGRHVSSSGRTHGGRSGGR